MAGQRTPDIVLLDIGLPDIDGFEVARRLRDEVGLKQARWWAFPAMPKTRKRSRAAGFDSHLLKPIPLDTLRAILRRATPDRTTPSG